MSQSTAKSDAATFTLHGKRYRLDRLITHAGSAPTITPKVGEMNLRTNPIDTPSDASKVLLEGYKGPVVFYPYEGKYLLLVGYDRVTQDLLGNLGEDDVVDANKVVKGKLLSKQLLKKCLDDGQEFVPPEQITRAEPRSVYDDREPAYGNGRGYEDRGYRDQPRDQPRDHRQPSFQPRPQSVPAATNTMRDQLSNLGLRPAAPMTPATGQPNRPSFSKPERPAFRARNPR